MFEIWQLGHVVQFLCIGFSNLALRDVRLESLIEICCTDTGVDDRKKDENDSNDGENCQRLSDWNVTLLLALLVHSEQFEDEVCQTAEE